jgi:hypothetical protein
MLTEGCRRPSIIKYDYAADAAAAKAAWTASWAAADAGTAKLNEGRACKSCFHIEAAVRCILPEHRCGHSTQTFEEIHLILKRSKIASDLYT